MDYSGKETKSKILGNNKVTTRLRTFSNQSKITIQMSRLRSYESPLVKKYGVEKYDRAGNYVFPDNVSELIPKNTPEYVDKGEN